MKDTLMSVTVCVWMAHVLILFRSGGARCSKSILSFEQVSSANTTVISCADCPEHQVAVVQCEIWGFHSGVALLTFRDMTQRFERSCRLFLQEFPVRKIFFYMDLDALQMRAIRSFETSGTVYPSTQRHTVVYSRLAVPHCSSLPECRVKCYLCICSK
jgi:hypothetical protein